MTGPRRVRVALYCRVSTSEQEVSGQLREIRSYISRSPSHSGRLVM